MADIPLPPGFTALKMSQARKAFEAALGSDKVFFEDLDRVGYQDKFAIDDMRHHPAGARGPASVEVFHAGVKIEKQKRLPLGTKTRGEKLG
jgi:4-cresol dehydrogenase (hydroxylating)